MKQYLVNFFNYNDWANRKLLEAIQQVPDQEELVKLFSHIIIAQDKWLNRVTKEKDDNSLPWSGTVFPIEELENKWTESCQKWLEVIQYKNEPELNADIIFNRASDGKLVKVKLQDIILQLNYHSIHHRAQMNKLISAQGITPPTTDYILTAISEVE